MKKRNSILLLVPLGAGLLYVGSQAPELPDAERRPAPSLSTEPFVASDQGPKIDVARIINEDIDYAPAEGVFLETVVLEGSAADKKAAIRELKNLGTDDAIRTLSLALADSDERVRRAALEALADIGGDEALAAIASATTASNPAHRAQAAEGLAGTGGYSASEYLALVLYDEDPRVRAAAVESLGDIGDSKSVNIISRALRDPEVEVRQRAAEVLDSLNDEALFHALNPR